MSVLDAAYVSYGERVAGRSRSFDDGLARRRAEWSKKRAHVGQLVQRADAIVLAHVARVGELQREIAATEEKIRAARVTHQMLRGWFNIKDAPLPVEDLQRAVDALETGECQPATRR